MKFDLIIKKAEVITGDGGPTAELDIGVKAGKILSIEKNLAGDAVRTIGASGMVACPGFVDMHSHSDLQALRDPRCVEKILQGVTTEVVGNCGFSLFPVLKAREKEAVEFLSLLFDDIGRKELFATGEDYFKTLKKNGTSTNIVPLAGHNMIRIAVNGFAKELSVDGLAECVRILEGELGAGASGISTGLLYSPVCHADRKELKALAGTVAEYRKIFAAHIRDEGDLLAESVDEIIGLGLETGARMEISHLKVSGKKNWGTMPKILGRLRQAVEQGCDVGFDAYPYPFGTTTLMALLPREILKDDFQELISDLSGTSFRERIRDSLKNPSCLLNNAGPENIFISSSENAEYTGKSIRQLADKSGKDVVDAICDILVREKGKTHIFLHQMNEDDVKKCLADPLCCLGSDGIPRRDGKTHPRLTSSFLRMIGKYVLEEKICGLAEGVRKMSSLPARRLGLEGRGVLKPGCFADICVFDPEKIRPDERTPGSPAFRAMDYVILNGKVVVEDCGYNGSLAGTVL